MLDSKIFLDFLCHRSVFGSHTAKQACSTPMMSNKVEFDTTVGVELYLIELVRRYECNMLL